MKTGRRLPLLVAGAALAVAGALASCSGGDDGAGAVAHETTAVAPAAVETTVAAAPATGIRRVSPADFAAVLKDQPARVLIDLRTPDEVKAGHLAGAREVDFYAATFEQDLAALDRGAPYAVYCQSGNRSGQTVAKMTLLGFRDVVELEGGIAAWKAAGLPVTAA